ncbi:hypothetical protein PFISCL1PPCAC_5876 [Pristionchus fissidentatus]|uniref:G protein-coupled receptor n=1 Tax=Pristionchus fissidentatus TaxID=1538716 RepID=A0AAV5V7W5_9BILA|nr:hypothetical protein PFISCL1PPCAC_5876 [Pristionchus fissidentatus]
MASSFCDEFLSSAERRGRKRMVAELFVFDATITILVSSSFCILSDILGFHFISQLWYYWISDLIVNIFFIAVIISIRINSRLELNRRALRNARIRHIAISFSYIYTALSSFRNILGLVQFVTILTKHYKSLLVPDYLSILTPEERKIQVAFESSVELVFLIIGINLIVLSYYEISAIRSIRKKASEFLKRMEENIESEGNQTNVEMGIV